MGRLITRCLFKPVSLSIYLLERLSPVCGAEQKKTKVGWLWYNSFSRTKPDLRSQLGDYWLLLNLINHPLP